MAKFSRRTLVSSSLSSFMFTYASTTKLTDPAFFSENLNSSVKAIKLPSSGKRSKRNSNSDDVDQNVAGHSYTTQSSQSTHTAGYNKYVPYTATPTPTNFYNNQSKTIQAQILAAERERIRAEFFATYDVMTGVRIAATLGGFFGLMVFLIVWKSRSSSNETLKVLKDPKMAAVAAVCMQEEEDREIQEAMVATGMSIFPDEYDAIAYRRQRLLSLGNVSAPPMLNRFSSVGGGYSCLLAPPRRFSYSATSAGNFASGRQNSISESSRIIENMGNSFGADDYFIESEDEIENADYTPAGNQMQKLTKQKTRTESTCSKGGFLEVPLPRQEQDSRRSSSMTCCSTESSYLERRYSAFTLGLSNLPQTLQRKLSTTSHNSSPGNWDYFYPDIQVIQPTPKPSPCLSEHSIGAQMQQTTNKSKTVISQRAANGKNKCLDRFPIHGSVIRKQSIAFYDPEKAQISHGQHIHSISADVVDIYPYNQTQPSAVGVNQGFHYAGIFAEPQRQKLAPNELEGISDGKAFEFTKTPLATCASNENKNYSYKNTAAIALTSSSGAANSSSISMDSTPLSIEKLNGSGSLGTISAKVLFNGAKRAPLASLSSFKISSLEYPDSEFQSPDEVSIFVNNGGDTDEDMQDISSDSEEVSLEGTHKLREVKKNNYFVSAEVEKKTLEKRNSLGTATVDRRRRSLLRRNLTISALSSDRISLKRQPAKEFSLNSITTESARTPKKGLPFLVTCISSPARHPRRAQLLQQYSDPQSLPTTTEDDTCSTLNTEVYAGMESGDTVGTGNGSAATTITQHSSLNTVISYGHTSPLSPINNPNDMSFSTVPFDQSKADKDVSAKIFSTSMSDSLIGSRQPIICMPSSLKDLILRGIGSTSGPHEKKLHIPATNAVTVAVSRSATNLSNLDTSMSGMKNIGNEDFERNRLSVMLELPLIKLPTGEDSDSSNTSNEYEQTKSNDDEPHDPSLPRSSRKWSKETLF